MGVTGQIKFECKECGSIHVGLPALTFASPALYHALSVNEREEAVLNKDFCKIGDTYFVRSVLIVPIRDETEGLEFGVWGTLSPENARRYGETFSDMDQSKLGPMFSWFASKLPGWPDTQSMQSRLLPQDNGKRPLVEFHPEDAHPLAVDVRQGISLERAVALVMPVLHPASERPQ